MDNLRCICIASLCFIMSTLAIADLPLTVEDLITDKGKLKLDTSLTYSNSDRQKLLTDEPIVVQTGETSFITLPTKFGEFKGNIDVLVATLGVRYGVTRDAEVYTRASYLYRSVRYSDLSGINNDRENRFVDSWAGFNYQFSQDNNTPALLGFIESALYEKHQQSSSSGKSWMLGMTIYRAIDPVVLSITSALQWNQKRNDGDVSFQPGSYFLLTPSVAFAVNDRVTLTTGFQWMNHRADRYDDKPQGFRRSSTDIMLGLGYGVSKGNTLNFSFKANASGQSGADLRLNWLYAF